MLPPQPSWSYPIVFAVSRDGVFDAFVLRPYGDYDILAQDNSRLAAGSTLLSHFGSGTAARRAPARPHRIAVHGGALWQQHPLRHCSRAYAYYGNFGRWLRRFGGIGTDYLQHYIAWHRTIIDAPPEVWLERCLQSWYVPAAPEPPPGHPPTFPVI